LKTNLSVEIGTNIDATSPIELQKTEKRKLEHRV
jgi:hypothetical protein